jgi:syntaxin 16
MSFPTTRSRTLLFISYRDSRAPSTRFSRSQRQYDDAYTGAGDEREGLMGPLDSPHISVPVELPPKWSDFFSFITAIRSSGILRVDVSDQVGEILEATHSKSASPCLLASHHVVSAAESHECLIKSRR